MTTESDRPLIIGPFPVTRGNRGDPPRPGHALVFSLNNGATELAVRRPSARASRRYSYLYEVDTTDKHMGWRELLPSSAAGYSFRAELEVTWRVSEAEEVVRRGIFSIRQGGSVVRTGLLKILIANTRRFDIEEHGRAEEALNSALGAGVHVLSEGITVSGFMARLDLDEAAEEFVRRKRALGWRKQIAYDEHEGNISAVRREGEIRALADEQERAIHEKRADAIRAAAKGEGGLLVQVVAQDPGQLRSVLQDLAAQQDVTMERKLQLLRELTANKLIQAADIDAIWQEYFRQSPVFNLESGERGLPSSSVVPGQMVTEPAGAAEASWSLADVEPPESATWPHKAENPDDDAAPSMEPSGPARYAQPRDGQSGVTGWRPVGRHRGGEDRE